MKRGALLVSWALVLSLSGRGDACAAGLYVRKASPQATMLATRARYRAWLAEQKEARGALTLGPWHAASPPRTKDPDQPPFSSPVEVAAKGNDGQRLWTRLAGWEDGVVRPLPLRGPSQGPAAVCLCRTLTASRPLTLMVGLGGGDHIDLWLNGTHILSQDTTLPFGRYGTGTKVDGTPVDQVIAGLPLHAGQNDLLLTVRQQHVARRKPLGFYFSPAPNPVPWLWRQVERDFPRSTHRLLEAVRYDWFAPTGWLAATDTRLEERLLARLLDEMGAGGKPIGQQLAQLTQENTPPADPRWLDLCVKAAQLATTLSDLHKLRAAVDALADAFPTDYPGRAFRARLDACERRLITMPPGRLDPQDPTTRRLAAELERSRREMLVDANPLLKGRRLLFARRITYDSMHYYDDHYNGLRAFGGNLCVLSLDDGRVTDLVSELRDGIFDRYDLSFDAKRIVFGYRKPKPDGFRLYEVRVDGTGLRQLTFPPPDEADRVARYSLRPPATLKSNPLLYGHWTDDLHPCYLPDGGIAFASSRCERSVLCGGHSLTTTCLYRVQADGSGLHQLSQGALSEFTPTMLADGRILYNRWEYIYKGIAAIQPLWAMRPDGSGSEEIYGDNIANPGVFVQARQVPGRPDLVVCAGLGHEPLSVGTIQLLDLHRDKRTPHVMTSLTPDTDVRGLRGLYQRRNGQWRAHDLYGPFYCDPYPLSDKFFLVVCNPDKRYNDPTAYGIHLLDVFGNRVLVHDDPDTSCWQPMLLEARPKPPVLPPAAPERSDGAPKDATVLVMDVYQGLDGVEPGTVKYLRVMEQIPRPWSVWPFPGGDGIPGQMVAVSYYTHIWVAVLHGIVPVHPDGSAHFTVPADRDIFLQALDENFMEVQKMRTFVNFQPGERRSCIGCHEHRRLAPVSRDVLALRHPPARPAPQPGESAPRPLHYPTDVQPVLDRHCVRCHSGEQPKKGLDLSGDPTSHFSRSYESLIKKGLVNFIQEWTGPRLNPPPPYFTVGGSMAHAPAVPPYTYGSHKSKLIARLRKGHNDVKLSREEFIKLVTWVDCNAPFYGSYFGRRNLRYRKHPDFRARPSLASACGIRPEPKKPKPVPAQLVAHWSFDEGQGEKAADASGSGHPGKIVGAKWTKGPKGNALLFDGKGYVEAQGLGSFEAASVTLWARADALKNTWSPMLFTWNWEPADFHFSLLRDGLVNLAVNPGEGSAIHNHSRSSAGDGRWHHLAVVADSRPGGYVTFYIDGRKDAEALVDSGLAFDLDRLRLGAYNCWERAPDNNFHGALDDVRVYRGMLTDRQVADLATIAGPSK